MHPTLRRMRICRRVGCSFGWMQLDVMIKTNKIPWEHANQMKRGCLF